jgi:hypothetical protein
MTKIEIEGKSWYGYSNHELKLNTIILIQIMNNQRIVSMFFLCLHVFPATIAKCSHITFCHISQNVNREIVPEGNGCLTTQTGPGPLAPKRKVARSRFIVPNKLSAHALTA